MGRPSKFSSVGIDDINRYIGMWENNSIGFNNTCKVIAEDIGISPRTAEAWLVKMKASINESNGGDSRYVTATSTLYDADGEVKLQWVKENVVKKEEENSFIEAISRIMEDVGSKEEITRNTEFEILSSDIMVKYPIADAHIGLLARKKQVGEDWGLEKAKKMFSDGIKMVVNSSPASEVALVLELGDMFHVADSTGKTRGHGHVLDVDGSLADIYEAALFIVTTIIDTALTKHETVIFRKTIGNHDGDTSIALGVFLKMLYKNNSRVVIESDENLYWWYTFGKTLHFSTHGHTVKQVALPEIVAHDCKEVWSDCKYVYVDTGHIHHQNIVETRTCLCESHNSLIVGDSFNYGSGYRSGRLLKSITYHKEHGEIARIVVRAGMIDG